MKRTLLYFIAPLLAATASHAIEWKGTGCPSPAAIQKEQYSPKNMDGKERSGQFGFVNKHDKGELNGGSWSVFNQKADAEKLESLSVQTDHKGNVDIVCHYNGGIYARKTLKNCQAN